MESRVKGRVLSIIVAVAMIASTSAVLAATTKPTPKPIAKPTVKASAKPTHKPSPKATPKKPVAKKITTKKKSAYRPKPVKVSPSPSPKWPPTTKGWTVNREVYAKVPTNNELLGVLSAAAALATQVKVCLKFACGAVDIASTNGCTWWEIDSTVSGPLSPTDSTRVPYGTLRTTAKGTNKKQITTVLLISTELLKKNLKKNVSVGGINISCYHSPVTEKVPTNVYRQNTPTPTPTPTPMTSDSPTPTPMTSDSPTTNTNETKTN
jgi:hypothetical protein